MSFSAETDLWGLGRQNTILTPSHFQTLYMTCEIGRRVIDFPPEAAFDKGILEEELPLETITDLIRLWKGVRLYGESVALIEGDTFQVVFPSVASGLSGYSVYYENGLEHHIRVAVSGGDGFDVPVGQYVRVMSDVMDGSDPYSGVSVLRNIYWSCLAHQDCVNALCGHVRVMSGGIFFWNIADTELDMGGLSSVASVVKDSLQRKTLFVRGEADAPEPKIITPSGQSYSMMDFIDYLVKLIAAEVGLPAVMIKGSEDGKLATSDVTLRVWFDRIRAYQKRISTDVAKVLGLDRVTFADPAGVDIETAGKLADVLIKVKDVLEPECMKELASRLLPSIDWRIKIERNPAPSVGPFGGGAPVGSTKADGTPGPSREEVDGVEY